MSLPLQPNSGSARQSVRSAAAPLRRKRVKMKSSNQNDKMQLVKEVPSGLFAKLLPELQNQFLYHDFAILPLRRVIERERTP